MSVRTWTSAGACGPGATPLLYVPFGNVKHKHRNRLRAMLKRRLEYGTSEGALYRLHPQKRKVLPVPVASALAFAALCASIVFLSPLPLPLCLACFLFDAASKTVRTAKMGIHIRPAKSGLFRRPNLPFLLLFRLVPSRQVLSRGDAHRRFCLSHPVAPGPFPPFPFLGCRLSDETAGPHLSGLSFFLRSRAYLLSDGCFLGMREGPHLRFLSDAPLDALREVDLGVLKYSTEIRIPGAPPNVALDPCFVLQ